MPRPLHAANRAGLSREIEHDVLTSNRRFHRGAVAHVAIDDTHAARFVIESGLAMAIA
jgi:hypothetical protein